MRVDDLKYASLGKIKATFMQLNPVPEVVRQGFFRASFIGPWWLRISAHPSLSLTGLPNWQGKKFINAANATNILQAEQRQIEKFHMQCLEQYSLVDGNMTTVLNYGAHAVKPWCWVVDEIRYLDQDTLLCMTVINVPVLRHFSFPFILSRDL